MRTSLISYLVSLAAVAVAVVVRLLLDPLLHDTFPFTTLFFAVSFAAWNGGTRAGLLALVAGGVSAAVFLLPLRPGFGVDGAEAQVGLALYGVVGFAFVAMFASRRKARQDAQMQRRRVEQEVITRRAAEHALAEQTERLQTTLANIGDAVITTDINARITTMNAVAESLTGWTSAEATGQLLDAVFRSVHATGRQTVEHPVTKALAPGIMGGLANHPILIARDGTERLIDESTAPIRRRGGEVLGCVLVFRDVSERARQEAELAERERQFRTLAESIPQLAWMANANGHVFWYNRRWYEYTGTTLEQMKGSGWRRVHDLGELPTLLERWKLCIATGIHFDKTYPLKGRDGQYRPFLTRVEPVKNDAGQVVRWFGTSTDVSAQKEVEDHLRRSEQFNRSLMDGTADCVKVLDTDGRLLHMNAPGMCAMEIDDFGSLSGQEWRATWPTDSQADIERSVTRAVVGEVSSFEAYCPTVKGRPKWWEVTVSPVRDAEGGRIVRLLAVSRDITDRKEAEDSLRASEAEFRAIFEQSAVGMAQVSATTRKFIRVNATYCELTGYSAEELVDMTPADLTFVADRDADTKALGSLLRGEVDSYDQDKRYLRKDGNIVWVHANATLLRDAKGRPERTMAVIQDITDRKEAEAERGRLLRRVEAERVHLAGVFRQAPAFLCVLRGPDHVFEMSNHRYDQLVGHRDLLGRPVRDALPELVAQGFVALLDNVYRNGEPFVGTNVRVLLVRQSGQPPEERYLDLVYEAYRDPSGEITGVVALGVDVTDRREANERLRTSEARFRSLVTASAPIVWTTGPGGEVVEDSPTWRAFTGQTVEQVLGWRWTTAVHPDDEEAAVAAWRGAVSTSTPVTSEYRLRRHDGEYRWTAMHAVPVMDEVGVVREWIGTNTDITSQKRAEQALRESEERYRAATAAVSDLIWTNNADGLMDDEQEGWQQFTGQSPDEYQGYGWSKAVHPEDAQPTLDAWARAVAEKRTFVFEHRVRRRDGEWRICAIRAVPLLHADGTIREWVGVHTDITERKRDEAALQQLTAELSDADRRKDEFLATLAHELRNPLAPIRNGLQVMKLAGVQVAAVEQTRSMMERQLTHMVRLVDDLMDVSRITRGHLELRKERVSLAAVLHSALEASRPLIEHMGHELTVTVPEQPIMVDADMTRLSQVFMNLLNNAAKYGEPGGLIQLDVEHCGSDVAVRVKDTGIGIAADELPRIFEMFTQTDRASEKSQGGLGIGLALAKRLVEMHGGEVEARSEGPGKGSEFVVRLPIVVDASTPHASGAEEEQPARTSLRVLIVDDNMDAADSLAMMLRFTGNDVRTAYDGQAGVDEAGKFRPDVIVFDIGLPTLDGYEACRRIREQSWGNSVMLIALTGWGQDEDRRRSHEAGFDHHVVKPVDMPTLMKLLAEARGATPR